MLKLKRRMHKDIAYAQDLIVSELYKIFPKTVIHGGTAIWRCYKGNRFSEDIDIYIRKDKEKIDKLFENLKKPGFLITKKRIKENSLYSTLIFNRTVVRLEAIFKDKQGIIKEYENSDGQLTTVYTLTPEDLVIEKISAYQNRKKIRDLYDIFFLLRYVKDEKNIRYHIRKFIADIPKPDDEENLKTIILSPPVPSIKEMIDYITRWAE